MKRIFKVCCLSMVLLLVSCGSSSPSIVGEWGLSEVDVGMEIPEEQQSLFDTMMQELKDNTLYIFKENGTMVAETWTGEKEINEGKYKYKDGLLTVEMDGVTEELECELSDSTLLILMEDQESKMSMLLLRK